MQPFLKFVNLDDVVPLLLIVFILRVMAAQVVAADEFALKMMNRVSYLGALAFFLAGWAEARSQRPLAVLELLCRTLIARELTRGVAAVGYPLLGKAYQALKAWHDERPRHQLAPYVPPPEPTRPPPQSPPPSPPKRSLQEQQEDAKRRHEERVAMLQKAALNDAELTAALAQAKRDYLNELDGLQP